MSKSARSHGWGFKVHESVLNCFSEVTNKTKLGETHQEAFRCLQRCAMNRVGTLRFLFVLAVASGCLREQTPGVSPAIYARWVEDSVRHEASLAKWRRDSIGLDSVAGTISIDSLVALYRAIETQRGDPATVIQAIVCEQDRVIIPYGITVASRVMRRAERVVWPDVEARRRAYRRLEPRVPNGTVFDSGKDKCGAVPARDSAPMGDLPRDDEPPRPVLRPRPT